MYQVRYESKEGHLGASTIKPGIHGTFATIEEAQEEKTKCRQWFGDRAKVWIEDLTNAEQITEAGQDDASSRPQSAVRQENGDSSARSEGIRRRRPVRGEAEQEPVKKEEVFDQTKG